MFLARRLRLLSNHVSPAIAMTLNTSTNPSFTRPLRTAACLIIGDEVLNGKTVDTNSSTLAKKCFSLGIALQRIETIGDIESEIIEAVQRMSSKYDLVVTSGGIGPTHDDLTYPSIAKAFGVPLELHEETKRRMRESSEKRQKEGKIPAFDWDTPSETLTARLRMATLPAGEGVRYVYPDPESWVPVVVVNYNVHILPGVPSIFTSLLEGLTKIWETEGRFSGKSGVRVLISTPLPESEVAPFLERLAKRVEVKGVKIGSYPRWGKDRNTVTLVGEDKEFIESLVAEVEEGVKGRRVQFEGEDDPADAAENA